jgi:uncharacterized protein
MKFLLVGLGLMLIFEGLMPLISPVKWREMFALISQLKDGQIRFMGLGAVMIGALFLLLA